MSERDGATGQFSEPLYGREALERDAGYVPLPDEDSGDSEEFTLRDAAGTLAEQRSTAEADIRTHSDISGLDDNVSLTQEQATKALTDMKDADEAQATNDENAKITEEVDKLRGVDAAKEAPKELDLTPEKVLEHPVFKETFEKLTSETETARANHVAGLAAATQIAEASFFGLHPEFANVAPEQRMALFAQIAQHDPARADSIRASVAQLGAVAEQYTAESQRLAQEQDTKLRSYVATESDRFEKMIANVPKAERLEIENGIVAKIKEYGGTVDQFKALLTKSEFSNATVQRLLYDVGKLHRIENAKAAVAARPVPAVQRPGIATSQRERTGADLSSLSDKLSRTGNIKDAVEFYAAKKARAR